MQTTNNPFAEIGVILIALGFIAAGTTLLALGKIDLNVAMTLYVLAASVAGINVALKAPSPTQQQLLVQALQAQQAQPAPAQSPVGQVPLSELNLRPGQTVNVTPQFVQAPAPPQGGSVIALTPVATPNTAAMMEQAAQYANALSMPATVAMPPAIMTTQNMPTVHPQ